MSSVYDVPCMYVRVFDIRDGMLAGSYVCTYGVLLRIRLTEGCQSVGNKRARERVIDASYSSVHGLSNNQSQYLVAAALPNTATSAGAVSYTHLTLPTTPYV